MAAASGRCNQINEDRPVVVITTPLSRRDAEWIEAVQRCYAFARSRQAGVQLLVENLLIGWLTDATVRRAAPRRGRPDARDWWSTSGPLPAEVAAMLADAVQARLDGRVDGAAEERAQDASLRHVVTDARGSVR